MTVKKWWSAQPRWFTRTLLGVAGTLVGVVAVTNLILWLGVVPRLLNAESAAFAYRFAWSPWPNFVRIHGLTITGQDDNVQFAVGLDDIDKEAWHVKHTGEPGNDEDDVCGF